MQFIRLVSNVLFLHYVLYVYYVFNCKAWVFKKKLDIRVGRGSLSGVEFEKKLTKKAGKSHTFVYSLRKVL